MNNPVISVQNVDAHYGERQVLFDVNLDVMPGEIVVIMGGSGSGKSTLLKHLLGLQVPTSGSILVHGKSLHDVSKKELKQLRKKMGVAFQGGALLSSLTVAENVSLPLEYNTDLDQNTIDIMVRLKLELMNLGGFGHLMPAELSGGMLKRAGLARAVIMDPNVLFFDEPSAGLDPVTSVELDELILKLRDAMNITMVIVTHELDSAFKIADRIMVLLDGRVVQVGTVEEIKRSDDERIQNLINRRPRSNQLHGDAYLQRLVNEEGEK
jgi:phospholipid/cholesterol/gamma-HCH transport system ATP-binding protein